MPTTIIVKSMQYAAEPVVACIITIVHYSSNIVCRSQI